MFAGIFKAEEFARILILVLLHIVEAFCLFVCPSVLRLNNLEHFFQKFYISVDF